MTEINYFLIPSISAVFHLISRHAHKFHALSVCSFQIKKKGSPHKSVKLAMLIWTEGFSTEHFSILILR